MVRLPVADGVHEAYHVNGSEKACVYTQKPEIKTSDMRTDGLGRRKEI